MNKELIDEIRVLADKLTYSCADELEISYAKEIARLCSKAAQDAINNLPADKFLYWEVMEAIKQALEWSDEKEGVV